MLAISYYESPLRRNKEVICSGLMGTERIAASLMSTLVPSAHSLVGSTRTSLPSFEGEEKMSISSEVQDPHWSLCLLEEDVLIEIDFEE